MGRLVLPSGRAVEINETGSEVDFLGTDATVDVGDLIWLAGYFAPFRESGGSVPERGGLLRPKSTGYDIPRGDQPPVLNKSGGSDVACTCRIHERGTRGEYRQADPACPVHR